MCNKAWIIQVNWPKGGPKFSIRKKIFHPNKIIPQSPPRKHSATSSKWDIIDLVSFHHVYLTRLEGKIMREGGLLLRGGLGWTIQQKSRKNTNTFNGFSALPTTPKAIWVHKKKPALAITLQLLSLLNSKTLDSCQSLLHNHNPFSSSYTDFFPAKSFKLLRNIPYYVIPQTLICFWVRKLIRTVCKKLKALWI